MTRPNFLFMIADDHRHSAIGALGTESVSTPTFDQLIADGACFSQAHIMGSTSGAVCMPSRGMLMSGCGLFQTPDPLPEDVPLLPELLRQHGYTTFGSGKWHNRRGSYARCFGESGKVFFGGMSDQYAMPVNDFDPAGEYPPDETYIANGYSTTVFSDEMIDFLKARSPEDEKPFFAYIAFTSPHDPRTPPPDWAGEYTPDAMPLPPNFMGQHPFDNGDMWLRDEQLADFPRTPEETRRHIAEYYGMISDMDEKIGEIVDALGRNGLAEDTIVVYTADHGLSVGQHGLLGKQNLYDHSVRVPLIMRGPGVATARQVDALTHTYDIYPTLCELAGLDIPDQVDARSLMPLIDGTAEETRPYLHAAYRHVQRMAQDREWKLIRYYTNSGEGSEGSDRTQLFHLKSDPWELNDLSEEDGVKAERERLEKELARWRLEVDDPMTAE